MARGLLLSRHRLQKGNSQIVCSHRRGTEIDDVSENVITIALATPEAIDDRRSCDWLVRRQMSGLLSWVKEHPFATATAVVGSALVVGNSAPVPVPFLSLN